MGNESFVTKVDGMICPQCEDEIAHRLLHSRGVISCEASYRRSQVTAVYDPDIISPDEIAHILADTGYPVGRGSSGARSDAIALAAVACLYFMIPAVTGLVKVPAAESGAGVGALFIIGVLTGVHCIGMCGGIMLSQRSALLYNGGRLLSYTVMGALFGAGLAFAGKKLAVPVDERIERVRECLPGAGCGACGFTGCDSYAAAVVNDGAPVNCCPVGGAKVAKAKSWGSMRGIPSAWSPPCSARAIRITARSNTNTRA